MYFHTFFFPVYEKDFEYIFYFWGELLGMFQEVIVLDAKKDTINREC